MLSRHNLCDIRCVCVFINKYIYIYIYICVCVCLADATLVSLPPYTNHDLYAMLSTISHPSLGARAPPATAASAGAGPGALLLCFFIHIHIICIYTYVYMYIYIYIYIYDNNNNDSNDLSLSLSLSTHMIRIMIIIIIMICSFGTPLVAGCCRGRRAGEGHAGRAIEPLARYRVSWQVVRYDVASRGAI